MKKIIALTFVFALVMSLTACGGMMGDVTSDVESIGDSIISGTQSTVDKATEGVESMIGGEEKSMDLMAGITAKHAKETALRHAGLDESQVSDGDLDRENGKLIYEVDFISGNTEYDYDINAETGEVISADKSKD